jgi:phage portal protein BeeE
MRLFRRRDEERTLPENRLPGIQPVYPGETLAPQAALRVADVYSCVRCLSDSAASLPLIPYRRLENGRVRVNGGPRKGEP